MVAEVESQMHGLVSPIEAIVFDAYGTLFDTQSVLSTLERAYPGYGEYLTQIWRLKQLEYSWLRSLAEDYVDFSIVTRDALSFSLGTIGIQLDASDLESLAQAYNQLTPYDDMSPMLSALAGRRLAVFSNGTTVMLEALLANVGLRDHFERVISVDDVRTFKPSQHTYRWACDTLGLPPQKVLLVSSNGFDLHGGARYGLQTARIQRVSAETIQAIVTEQAPIRPSAIFLALRSQIESLGSRPTITLRSLTELADAVASIGH
jgi:2-haloacid dehalogenase